MRIVAVLWIVVLAVTVHAQSSVAAHVIAGDFDELFQAAPECKETARMMAAYGPDRYSDKIKPKLESCDRQVLAAIKMVDQHAKTGSTPAKTNTERGAIGLGMRLIHIQHLLLIEAMQNDTIQPLKDD